MYDVLARRYEVRYEDGAGRQPDFAVYRGDRYVGRVEVVTLLQRNEWDADGRRHAQLVEQINQRLRLTTHSVTFDIQRWTNQPSMKHLIAWLQSTIAALPAQMSASNGDAGGPVHTYTGRSAEITFEFLPLPPGRPVTDDDVVVVGGWFLRARRRHAEDRRGCSPALSRDGVVPRRSAAD